MKDKSIARTKAVPTIQRLHEMAERKVATSWSHGASCATTSLAKVLYRDAEKREGGREGREKSLGCISCDEEYRCLRSRAPSLTSSLKRIHVFL